MIHASDLWISDPSKQLILISRTRTQFEQWTSFRLLKAQRGTVGIAAIHSASAGHTIGHRGSYQPRRAVSANMKITYARLLSTTSSLAAGKQLNQFRAPRAKLGFALVALWAATGCAALGLGESPAKPTEPAKPEPLHVVRAAGMRDDAVIKAATEIMQRNKMHVDGETVLKLQINSDSWFVRYVEGMRADKCRPVEEREIALGYVVKNNKDGKCRYYELIYSQEADDLCGTTFLKPSVKELQDSRPTSCEVTP
jgi:hypothetical protein